MLLKKKIKKPQQSNQNLVKRKIKQVLENRIELNLFLHFCAFWMTLFDVFYLVVGDIFICYSFFNLKYFSSYLLVFLSFLISVLKENTSQGLSEVIKCGVTFIDFKQQKKLYPQMFEEMGKKFNYF